MHVLPFLTGLLSHLQPRAPLTGESSLVPSPNRSSMTPSSTATPLSLWSVASKSTSSHDDGVTSCDCVMPPSSSSSSSTSTSTPTSCTSASAVASTSGITVCDPKLCWTISHEAISAVTTPYYSYDYATAWLFDATDAGSSKQTLIPATNCSSYGPANGEIPLTVMSVVSGPAIPPLACLAFQGCDKSSALERKD